MRSLFLCLKFPHSAHSFIKEFFKNVLLTEKNFKKKRQKKRVFLSKKGRATHAKQKIVGVFYVCCNIFSLTAVAFPSFLFFSSNFLPLLYLNELKHITWKKIRRKRENNGIFFIFFHLFIFYLNSTFYFN
ncbi:hypothetical protein Mgra_00001621 [Meloidogyne graminicola]|uniref:Transmembrane protein n=1 Tax=Meloidogyne graminicola TaxID=189291 RepID=A0A8T0A132_9BILA|nr:hypothetical protein Mgra_00001621 [Meloidogyne graminicola]